MHNLIYIMYEVNEWESVFFLIPRTPSRNWLCKKQAATPPNRPSIHPSITKKTRSTMVIIIVIRKHQGDNKAYRQTADGQCWMDRQNRQIFSYCYDHRFRRIKIWTKMFFSRLRFTSARRQCVVGWRWWWWFIWMEYDPFLNCWFTIKPSKSNGSSRHHTTSSASMAVLTALPPPPWSSSSVPVVAAAAKKA